MSFVRNFLFGADYYEEYMPYERLEEDMQLMEDAGINTIRIAESTWSTEEPEPGVFDLSHVIRTIEAAERHGINVVIGTPTYAIPSWLDRLDPSILGSNKFGPRQNMDITNPTYLHYAERIIRKLVSETAGYSNVIGFQVDNETKHYGTHSPQVISGFRDWLRKRFDSIEDLNHAFGMRHWSDSVASFDELPDPTGSVNASYIGAFEEYRRELASNFLHWQADIVREYKRDDQFITHNFDYFWRELSDEGQQMGYSAGLQPDLNCYEAAKALDIAGTDIYFKPGDDLSGYEIAFGGDLIRNLKKAPYIVLESQSQAFSGWLPYPGQLRLMAYSHIASGARGIFYWPWMSIHNSIESYWKGILSHDCEPGYMYDEVSRIGRELKSHPVLFSGLVKKNRIALIVSPEALHALNHLPTDRGLHYNDVVEVFYRAFYELGLECDVLYDREPDWSGYDMIVFPQLYSADDSMIERVRSFVADGGTVFASFRSFFADENLAVRHDRQPHGLTDVFGMHYSLFTKSEDSSWIELLEPENAEAIEHHSGKYWSKYAAVTRNKYGKGTAWYIGKLTEADKLKEYVIRACADAGIDVPEYAWPVIVRKAYTEEGHILSFILNYSSDETTVKCPLDGIDIMTGEKVSRGDELHLSDWDARIISD